MVGFMITVKFLVSETNVCNIDNIRAPNITPAPLASKHAFPNFKNHNYKIDLVTLHTYVTLA